MPTFHSDLRQPRTPEEEESRKKNINDAYKTGLYAFWIMVVAVVLGVLTTGTLLLVVFQVIAFAAVLTLAGCVAVYVYNTLP